MPNKKEESFRYCLAILYQSLAIEYYGWFVYKQLFEKKENNKEAEYIKTEI